MLISSDLANLGKFLRSKTPQMNTKGVDSVRSPVANLVGIRRDVTQDEFIRQVANSFHYVFSKGDLSADSFRQLLQNKSADVQVVEVDQEEVLNSVNERALKIQADMDGLKTWDWVFGQTPEFTITLEDKLSFGQIKMDITSKHAIITHCSIEITTANQQSEVNLQKLESKLVGQRYDDVTPIMEQAGAKGSAVESEIVSWLRRSV